MLPPNSTIPLSFSLLHEYLRLVFRRERQSFSLSPPPPSAKAGLSPARSPKLSRPPPSIGPLDTDVDQRPFPVPCIYSIFVDRVIVAFTFV